MIVWIGVVVVWLGAAGTAVLARLCWRYRRQTEAALREIRALRAQEIYRTEPANPRSGHPGTCKCGPCAIFWDTARGEQTYRALLGQEVDPGVARSGPYCKLCRDYGCAHPHTGLPEAGEQRGPAVWGQM